MCASSSVLVSIYGPRSLISVPFKGKLKKSRTWLDVLVNTLGLKVSKTKGIFVCTQRYCAMSPKPGNGWRSEVTDTVSSFISKFQRKRSFYSVRFCDSSGVLSRRKGEISRRRKIATNNYRKSTQINNAKQCCAKAITFKAFRMAAAQSLPTCSSESAPTIPKRRSSLSVRSTSEETICIFANDEILEEVHISEENNPKDGDDPGGCLPKNKTSETFCRRGAGELLERDKKHTAIKRLYQMKNKTLITVEDELARLRTSKSWDVCVSACPATFDLVQELLREHPINRNNPIKNIAPQTLNQSKYFGWQLLGGG